MSIAPAAALDLDVLDELRPGLIGYCYRMLGSVFEADDAVQDTMVRAWQHHASFDGRASARTWLYRIATNVCIDIIRGRSRRAMPVDLGPASDVAAMVSAEPTSYPWISPLPGGDNPADLAESKETIRLAFVAALQHLPARQRAVLILRDVLSWPTGEVAELLDASVPAVNSVLQRARATVAGQDLVTGTSVENLSDDDRKLLADYVDAFERYDIGALVALLRKDAIQSMPPYAQWFRGAEKIGRFMLGPGAGCRGSRLVPTIANGTAAFGQYRSDGNGGHLPWSIQVIEVRDGQIAELHCFLDLALFAIFGLPTAL